MNLPIPQVGLEAGPQYATDVNNCLTLVDQHDHTPGYGVQVPPGGLNINSDLTIQNNNLTNIRSSRFFSQPSPLAQPTDLDCVYVTGVDLYYNDGAGNQIRLTQSGAVAGTPGSIGNLIPPASVTYSPSTQTFIFQSDVDVPAYLDSAAITLRDLSLNSPGVTLNPPPGLVSDYDLTLPELQGSDLPIVLQTDGTMVAEQITTAMLSPGAVQFLMPSGAIIPYGAPAAPIGWLLCDGTSYLRSTFPQLFAVIGTAFGSADGTHFNVPDARGYFPRAVDSGAGRDPDASSRTAMNPGGNTGDNVGSIQGGGVQSHVHPTQTGSNPTGGGGTVFISGNTNTNVVNTGSNGGALAETRPINFYANFIIKT